MERSSGAGTRCCRCCPDGILTAATVLRIRWHSGVMTPDEDPTADFLAEVRAPETPWRRDLPPGERPERAERVEKWGRVARTAAQAAPYVQAAALLAWLASGAFDDGAGAGDQSGSTS